MDPPWETLPPGTPAAVRRLLRRCLERDIKRRLRDIGDARIDIEEAQAAPAAEDDSGVSVPVARAGQTGRRLPWILAGGVAVLSAITL